MAPTWFAITLQPADVLLTPACMYHFETGVWQRLGPALVVGDVL